MTRLRAGSLRAGALLLGGAICALSLSAPVYAQAQNDRDTDLPGLQDHYTDLWARGEYQAALDGVEQLIASSNNYVTVRLRRHRAQLLFAVGQVDEAIKEMKRVSDLYSRPADTLELALMYRYAGRLDEYEIALNEAARHTRGAQWRYSDREENYVAMGRIAELLGENPKTILNTHFGVLLDRYPNMVEAHIGAGDLAYRHAGYDIAAGHYQKALSIDPDNQEALAGLAEAYWKSNDGRLGETLAELFKRNPHHPRGKAIEIEEMLDAGEWRDALKATDEALKINPVDTRFRSLRAAAYFLGDDAKNMERVQREVLAFNPHCSEVYRTAGRIASRHYRFREAADLQQRALEIDPNDYEARALYSLDLLRLGDETSGRAALEKAFAQDPYNVHMFNLLELMDTLETFDVIERGPFVLKLPKHETPLVAEDALDLLQDAYDTYTAKYDVELELPVLVEMFDQHDDFMVRSVGLPGSVGHLGICFGRLVTLDSPSARPRGSWNWRSVLWHEFVHVITLQKTKNRMPRWLSEGISVHEENVYSPAWKTKMDAEYRLIINDSGIPSVRGIEKFFTEPKSATHLMFGYFIAGEFIDFYVAEYGYEALNAALELVAEGAETEESLAKTAGLTLRELDGVFHTYQEKRYAAFDNLPDPVELAKAAAQSHKVVWPPPKELPGIKDEPGASPYTDALEAANKAIEAKEWAKAVTALERAHELYPEHTGPDAPLRQLVHVYREMGEDAKVRETLERILYWTPAELEAAKKLALDYREDGEWAKVVEVAHWALGIDPYDVELQKTYMTALLETDQDEPALEALSIVAHLDPARATEYKLNRVEILGTLGKFDQAKTELVRTLEETPHYWKAQQMLLDILESTDSALPEPGLIVDEAPKR